MLVQAPSGILPSRVCQPARARPFRFCALLEACLPSNRDVSCAYWLISPPWPSPAIFSFLVSVTPLIFMECAGPLRVPICVGADGVWRGLPAGGVAASHLQNAWRCPGKSTWSRTTARCWRTVNPNREPERHQHRDLAHPMLISALAVTLVRPAAIPQRCCCSQAVRAPQHRPGTASCSRRRPSAALHWPGRRLSAHHHRHRVHCAQPMGADDQQPCGPLRLPNHRRKQHIAGLQLQITGFDQRNLSFAGYRG